MHESQAFEQLRIAIETAVDRKMKTAHDFDFLAEAIYEKLHQTVSTSTLKRFWGYLPQYASIRTSTLDLLSQFVGYKDWNAFEQSTSSGNETSSPLGEGAGMRLAGSWGLVFLFICFILAALIGWLFFREDGADDSSTDSQPYILRRGQTFATTNDYLRLFGITSTEHYWDQPLPHHDGIIVWGPEYHHPQWHNEGDADSLMPTITEWWTPTDSLDEAERRVLTTERNGHLYFTVMRTNELRITFMKNLVDTSYVFLGIYRTDLRQSDSTHVVWERVADECDLSNLSYLQQLRH